MIKIICDICKKEISEYDCKNINVVNKVTENEIGYSITNSDIDICEKCFYEFEKEKCIHEIKILKKIARSMI